MTEVAADEVPRGPFRTTYGEVKVTVSEQGVSFLPFSGGLDRDRYRIVLIMIGLALFGVGAVLLTLEMETAARISGAVAGVSFISSLLWIALEGVIDAGFRLTVGSSVDHLPADSVTTLATADLTAVGEVTGRLVPRFSFRCAGDEVVVAGTAWRAGSLRQLRTAVLASSR